MKTRWLVVLACLLVTSISNADAAPNAPTENQESSLLDSHVMPAPKPVPVFAVQDETQDPEKKDAETKDAETADDEPQSRDDQVKSLLKKIADARKEYNAAMRAAAAEDRAQVYAEKFPKPENFADGFLKLVDENSDDDAAFKALIWISTNLPKGEAQENAFELLFSKHIDREELKTVCIMFSRASPSADVKERLELLIEKSPHASVKGHAIFAKAKLLGTIASYKDIIDTNPAARKSLGEETVAFLESTNVDPKTVESLYQSLSDDYPDFKMGSRTFKEIAESALFEIRRLAIGMTVPDIKNVDFDGTTFKLSDYRGKIVLIDFWGDW